MKILERVLLLSFVIFIALKLMLVRTVSAFFPLTLTALAFLYCYFSFALLNGIKLKKVFKRDSYHGIPAIRMIGAIFTGIVLSLVCLSVLFKLMVWAGYAIMATVGLVGCLIPLFISLAKINGRHSAFYRRVLVHVAVAGLFSAACVFIPETEVVALFFRDRPTLVEAYRQASADPQNDSLWRNVSNEFRKLNTQNIHTH